MKLIPFAALVLSVAALTGCDKPQQQPKQQRFQIVFNPNVRADTFLLDTEKGRVWQMTKLTDLEGQPTIWMQMDVVDETGEMGITAKELRSSYRSIRKN